MTDAFKTTAHPMGGTFNWYRLGDRAFSVLDDQFPGNEDFELHERVPEDNEDVDNWSIIRGTELHFESLDAAVSWIDSQ